MIIQQIATPVLQRGVSLSSFDVSAFLKRGFDLAFVVMAMPIVLPLMGIIAALVKLDSSGSVFYTQYRHGQLGQQFLIYKFRTMQTDYCTPFGGKQVRPNDQRCTRLGRFLRRSSLDELPQMFNILKGNMSLVGPRPHAVDHNDYYGSKIARYWHRHWCKPGLTGLAQVSGCRGQTKTIDAMADRVKYDLVYVERSSLWLDVKIVCLTFRELFFPRNAH